MSHNQGSAKPRRNSGGSGGGQRLSRSPAPTCSKGGNCVGAGASSGSSPKGYPSTNGAGPMMSGHEGEEQNLRHQFLSGCSDPPPKCVEREVDRLMGCAKSYCEKEKFKLKQFYEEELVKKKKALLSEFRCALEREVIAPLKQRLCEYEREVYRLQQELDRLTKERANSGPQTDQDGNTPRHTAEECDQLDHLHQELDAALKEKQALEEMMAKERQRKKGSVATRKKILMMEDGSVAAEPEPGPDSESAQQQAGEGFLDSSQSEATSAQPNMTTAGTNSDDSAKSGAEVGTGPEGMSGAEVGTGPEGISGAEVGSGPDVKSGAEVGSGPEVKSGAEAKSGPEAKSVPEVKSGPDERAIPKTKKSRPDGRAMPKTKESAPFPESASNEVKALLQRIRELADALDEYKHFAQQQIDDLIKEGEIMARWFKRAEELEKENAELKRIIEDLMRQLQAAKPDKGTEDHEMMTLRKTLADMEAHRNKGSMMDELEALKKQLEETKRLKEEADAKALHAQETAKSVVALEEDKKRSSTDSAKAKRSSRKTSASKEDDETDKAGDTTAETKPIVEVETCPPCPDLSGPYKDQIEDLNARIKELEEKLATFNELEMKMKAMEEELKELEELKKKYAEQLIELESLRNPVCPKPSETELNELKAKYADAEAKLASLQDELDKLKLELVDLRGKETLLAKTELDLKQLQDEVKRAENEIQRLSDEIKSMSSKAAQLEAENAELNKALEELGQKYKDTQDQYNKAHAENERLKNELQDLKDDLRNRNRVEGELRRELAAKEQEISDLKNRLVPLEAENETLKKDIDDLLKQVRASDTAREKLAKELEEARRKIREIEQKLKEQEELAKEQARKCQEECGILSKKGQCILAHEQKSLALAGQLEADNSAIRVRLRQLEEQLDAMASMENRTRAIHNEMAELQTRARDRSKKLEELQSLDCDIAPPVANFISEVSISESYPALPVPSDAGVNGKQGSSTNISAKSDKDGWLSLQVEDNTQCILLSKQLEDLEQQRTSLSAELEGNLKAVDNLNKILTQVNNENTRLAEEKEKACARPKPEEDSNSTSSKKSKKPSSQS